MLNRITQLTRGAGYMRQSINEPQVNDDQAARIARRAEARGYALTKMYFESDTSHEFREDLSRLFEDAAAGLFDVVICLDPTRLARKFGEMERILERLATLDVRIECVSY